MYIAMPPTFKRFVDLNVQRSSDETIVRRAVKTSAVGLVAAAMATAAMATVLSLALQ